MGKIGKFLFGSEPAISRLVDRGRSVKVQFKSFICSFLYLWSNPILWFDVAKTTYILWFGITIATYILWLD